MKLKNLVLPLIAFALSASAANAQSAKDVFDKETKLTWIGLDWTKTRLIGDAAAKADQIVEKNFVEVNQKVVNEYKKFDVAKAFRRSEVSTDIGPVNKRTAKIDPDNLLSDNSDDYQHLKPEDITTLVKGFDFNGKTGIGIVWFVEGINKTKKEISAYVTLVDMKAKKVLFTERMVGKMGGKFGVAFGYANMYLTGVKSILDDIEKDKYKEWKSTYGG
ncbi:hypothetical protein [Chitinophaga rhizosphaerae]|uniref:hypothetical protein n=1 Tax=Chitinophaga rhizosphaerae TaxID=1864947 RepID=UPI000F80A2A9|nr:hypothetical protein [Chitinophaga rhizosphaerae]